MAHNAMKIILFLIFYTNLVFCQSGDDVCTPSDYPEFRDSSLFRLGPHGQILVIDYQFLCDGLVTQWELQCVRNGSHPVEFQVWRQDRSILTATVYNLVGKNVLPNARPDVNNLLSYSVPQDKQIRVQPGDIVGLRALNGTEPNPWQARAHFLLNGGAMQYTLGEDEETPNILNLDEVENSLIFPPIMRVTVDSSPLPIATMSTTTSTSSTTNTLSDSLPQSIIIVIIIALVLVLVLIITVIVVISCCCIAVSRSHNSNQKERRPVTIAGDYLETVPNSAYNAGGQEGNYNDASLYYYTSSQAVNGELQSGDNVVYDYIEDRNAYGSAQGVIAVETDQQSAAYVSVDDVTTTQDVTDGGYIPVL